MSATIRNILRSVAVLGMSGMAFGQCDLSSAPSNPAYVDTTFDHSTVADANGGWNVTPAVFSELGSHAIGDTVIFNGVVGAYTPSGGTSASSRDLDWLRMSVSQPCYIAVTLSMGRDVGGVKVPFSSPDQSYISIYSGSVQATAKSLSYGYDTDGCPQNPVVKLPNGTQMGKIPLPVGDATIVVTTPFNPTGTTQYNGPIYYSLKVEVLALDNGRCGTATNDCVTASGTGGCSDATCCDTVCGFNPECCNVAWDAACINYGVTQCGNFVFKCTNPVAENDCMTGAAPVDVSGGSITFGFDNTGANTDGPNNVNTQCSSNSARDIWYVAGPLPTDGDLKVTMCGQGNVGDSVVCMYDLGTSSSVTDPTTLPSKYIGCRDDSCDDNADGSTDAGGPSAINMIGVLKDHYILIRVGTFLGAGEDPASAPALQPGSMTVSFRSGLYDNGRQKAVKKVSGGTLTNLFASRGYASSTSTASVMAIPFTLTQGGSVDGFEFVGYNYSSGSLPSGAQIADTLHWIVYSRGPEWLTKFGASNGDNLVAEGTVTFNPASYSNINSDFGRRYFIDLPTPTVLTAGDYYFMLKPEKAGASNGAFGIFYYGSAAIPQTIQSGSSIGKASYWANPTYPSGSWGNYTWTAPQVYDVQTGDNVGQLYKPAFRLKGVVSACFGDIDGSGVVDNGDVAFALLDYGVCGGCPSDLDGSGEVDFGDIALILLSTGPC
jgi:hypothetical protein